MGQIEIFLVLNKQKDKKEKKKEQERKKYRRVLWYGEVFEIIIFSFTHIFR